MELERREFIAVTTGVGFAGCSRTDFTEAPDEETPTVTPAAVPDEGAASDIGSRFGPDAPCPTDTSCFHNDSSELVLVVDPERFDTDSRVGVSTLRNRGTNTWDFVSDYHIHKHTGSRWVRVSRPRVLDRGGIRVPPGSEIRRELTIQDVFGIEILGKGLYACTQAAYRVGAGDEGTDRVAGLFEVEGTSYTPTPTRGDTVRENGTVHIGENRSEPVFVVERSSKAEPEGVPLVPEAVGSRPVLRESVPRLGGATDEVRTYITDATRGMEYLQQAMARPTVVDADTVFEFDGIDFTAEVRSSEE